MPPRTTPPESVERRAIRRLLAERGIGRHALFLTQREGIRLPGGLESLSGFVLTADGTVYSFWFGWDQRLRTFVLDPLAMVHAPDREFADDAEYRQARRALGLEPHVDW